MKLETEGRGDFANPDVELVKTELGKLNSSDNSFAVLSDDIGFVQTARSTGGFVLEYRDGSGYFGTTDENLSLAQVRDAFAQFVAGESGWKRAFEWVPRESGDGAESVSRPTGGTASVPTSANPVEDLLGTVKNEAMRFAKRKLRGLFRK